MRKDIKYVWDMAGKFKFKKFFSYSGTKDNGASVIITSRQVLITPNIYNYKGTHPYTQLTMIKAIYSQSDEDIVEQFRLTNQAIRMDLISEGNRKRIMIHFPEEITKEQTDLLQAFQNTYGKIVERISQRYVSKSPDNDPIVLYDNGGSDRYSHSFQDALKYAQNSIPKKEIDTPDENIIGQVMSYDELILCDSSELKKLGELKETALEDGVTLEDCRSFWGHIRGLFPKTRSGR